MATIQRDTTEAAAQAREYREALGGTTLPEGASVDWLAPEEMRTLGAVCDTLIPALTPPDGRDDPHGLFARSAADLHVARMLAETLAAEPEETRAELARLLRLLDSPAGGLLLARSPRSFAALPAATREAALRRMSTSPLPQLRQGFQALKRLATFLFYAMPVEDGCNPNWRAIGYAPPRAHESAPKRIRTLAVDRDVTLDADVVVVGSGAGGAVIAAELTAAGLDVLVLEKGDYLNESDFNGSEFELTPRLYLRRGLLATRDLGVVVLAGSALGGGTIVNWSTSLRTEDVVLDEWERRFGLTGVTGAEYRRGFDLVERRLGINTDDNVPNRNNAILQRGCRALGYSWRYVPRNASGCAQRCGACGYGCPYGRKQSALLTFLQDASDRGARTIVGCDVRRVLIDHGSAAGVEGWVRDAATGRRQRIVVRAPRVVCAAGAVESPALLLRSGLDNPNIGRHLRLHPVAAVASRYAEPIEPWSGSLQTVMSDHFAHLEDGYGVRIEASPAHPGMLGMAMPWAGGRLHKEQMLDAAHHAATIVLVRDTGEGRVTADRQGEPVLDYWPNATDCYRLMRGMHEAARIACAAGATRVVTLHTPQLTLESEDGRAGALTGARLRSFLEEIRRRGVVPNRLLLFSAHQMGTCRLGADARTAVADPYGQVYGVHGLYVGDASGFPTACGVNPMVSVMALAYRVARRIRAEA